MVKLFIGICTFKFQILYFLFIYSPINLIDNQENRIAYALAFGATATLVLDLFSGTFEYYYDAASNQPWVRSKSVCKCVCG